MTTPRIQPVEPPYDTELQQSFDIIMPPDTPPLNIFRVVGRNPRVLRRMVTGGLLDRGSISIADRELAILRTTAICGAEYEWGVHVAIYAGKAGFVPEQIEATCAATIDPELWSEPQQAIIRMADELHATSTLSDATWRELQRHFDDAQRVELVMLAGLYHAVSYVVNSFAVDPESFAPGFPQH